MLTQGQGPLAFPSPNQVMSGRSSAKTCGGFSALLQRVPQVFCVQHFAAPEWFSAVRAQHLAAGKTSTVSFLRGTNIGCSECCCQECSRRPASTETHWRDNADRRRCRDTFFFPAVLLRSMKTFCISWWTNTCIIHHDTPHLQLKIETT